MVAGPRNQNSIISKLKGSLKVGPLRCLVNCPSTVRVLLTRRSRHHPKLVRLRFSPFPSVLLYSALTRLPFFVSEKVSVMLEHHWSRVSGDFHAVFHGVARLPHLMGSRSSEIVEMFADIFRLPAFLATVRAFPLSIEQ